MTDHKSIDTLLKIHNLSIASSDEEIGLALTSANYNQEEIDKLIFELRNSKRDNEIKNAGICRMYRTDSSLKPEEIRVLLGIDIEVNKLPTDMRIAKPTNALSNLLVIIVATLLAIIGVVTMMYENQVGSFYSSASVLDE